MKNLTLNSNNHELKGKEKWKILSFFHLVFTLNGASKLFDPVWKGIHN